MHALEGDNIRQYLKILSFKFFKGIKLSIILILALLMGLFLTKEIASHLNYQIVTRVSISIPSAVHLINGYQPWINPLTIHKEKITTTSKYVKFLNFTKNHTFLIKISNIKPIQEISYFSDPNMGQLEFNRCFWTANMIILQLC